MTRNKFVIELEWYWYEHGGLTEQATFEDLMAAVVDLKLTNYGILL